MELRGEFKEFWAKLSKDGVWMTVDPSIATPGIGVFKGDRVVELYHPVMDREGNLPERIGLLMDSFDGIMNEHAPELAIIEIPNDWVRSSARQTHYQTPDPRPPSVFDSDRPLNVADLLKLTMGVGAFLCALHHKKVPTFPIQVDEWKGKKSKEYTHGFVKRRWPDLKVKNNNALDAGALGVWALNGGRI